MNYPNLDIPIVDGRFAPDGNSFAVSTYCGSFSIYGYGETDFYKYSPTDQFISENALIEIENEIDQVEMNNIMELMIRENQSPNIQVCDFSLRPHEIQPKINFKKMVNKKMFEWKKFDNTKENKNFWDNDQILKDFKHLFYFYKKNQMEKKNFQIEQDCFKYMKKTILKAQKDKFLAIGKSLKERITVQNIREENIDVNLLNNQKNIDKNKEKTRKKFKRLSKANNENDEKNLLDYLSQNNENNNDENINFFDEEYIPKEFESDNDRINDRSLRHSKRLLRNSQMTYLENNENDNNNNYERSYFLLFKIIRKYKKN